MAKDVGTAICKSIAVSFLPCLVAFLGFYPYMFLLKINASKPYSLLNNAQPLKGLGMGPVSRHPWE